MTVRKGAGGMTGTMKAVVFDRPYSMEVREVPIPEIGEDQALVRVEAVGICGTDVHLYEGDFVPRFPLIPGHEFAGVIEKVGSAVEGFRPGDRVAVDPSIFCESCYFCNQNLQNHCENWNALGVTRPGAFAQYVAVPKKGLFHIRNLSFSEGAFVEPLACVVYGQERARPRLGDEVLIFGCGPIGLLHLQLIRLAGAVSVTMVDKRQDRLDLARRLGADHVVLADETQQERLREIAPRGFDVVIDATGVPKVVESAIQYVKNAGKMLFFGVCPNESAITINPYEVYKRDLELIGSFALNKNFQAALNILESGAIDVKPLIGATVNLEEFPQALQAMAQGKAPMKIQVDPQSRQPAGQLKLDGAA